MSKEKQPAIWLGRPILAEDHAQALEQAAAVHEFNDKLPRQEAEKKAYDNYVRDHKLAACAHHLAGARAALAAGHREEAQKHGQMYEQHAKALGFDPYGPVPSEITSKLTAPDRTPLYRFKAHPLDVLEQQQALSKSEKSTCEWPETLTTKQRCLNPQTRKVGDKHYCHHHADLAAKAEHKRMTTPENLTKSQRAAGHWRSEDGLQIPKAGTPDRKRWDKAFEEALKRHFGSDMELVEIAVDNTIPRNPPQNRARLDLYQRMATKERTLPVPVVEPSASGWYVKDGNHRIEAAKRAGVKKLYALNTSPGRRPVVD